MTSVQRCDLHGGSVMVASGLTSDETSAPLDNITFGSLKPLTVRGSLAFCGLPLYWAAETVSNCSLPH